MSLPVVIPRGPGFWKFNNTLLDDEVYIAHIRKLIPQIREKYSFVQVKRLFWELMKMEIREKSISFAKQKSRALFERETEISRRLDHLDNLICNSNNLLNINTTLNEYEALKTELHSIYDRKGKAAMFRSKCRWIENGEKPTKYYFNLEKRNYNRKTINKLRKQDGVEIREEKEILKVIQEFYEDLYSSEISTSQEQFDLFISNVIFPKLSDEDREEIEGPLTLNECKRVLESFQENKWPGKDGFTVKFYKYFFDSVGSYLLESLNAAYEVGKLSISQRRGVITLIPKDDSDLLDLQNWRPITLLNTDYKIASKALARRIETILPKLLHPDQTGFMRERYIGENLRLISDVLEYTKDEDLTGILVSLDFRKAFDTLKWPFIKSVLNLFNFGESVKRWTSIFYTDVESAVLNNGFATNYYYWFKPTRGVRQGCPLSPYLFILGAEILSNKIRQSKLVKGINIYGNEVKVSQFADDTNLFCEDITSVDKAICLVNDFAPVSGLKLNVKKTKVLWLGKWRNNRTTPLQLSWPRNPVKILGIYFSYDDKTNNHYNFNLTIQKLQTYLNMWSSRSLTLFGKVLIIKSLGLSQILYSASNTNVPKDTITTVKRKLFSFLWNKKKDKIKREGLYQDYDKGGIRMTDVGLMLKAMRLAWIPRLLKHANSNWNSVPDFFLRRLGGLNFLLRCNYDVIFLHLKLPTFCKDMLSFFDDLKTLYNYNLGQIVLFNNWEILIDSKPFFIQEWFSKGIILIRDLLDEQGQLLSYQAFKTKYKCKTNFLNYYQVRSAIPDSLLAKTKNNDLEPFPRASFYKTTQFLILIVQRR